MTEPDGSDRRNAFLRLLPARADVIGRRLERFAESGWDINGLALIHGDAERLGADSRAFGIDAAIEPLEGIAVLVDHLLVSETLPDETLGLRLRELGRQLVAVVPPAPPAEPVEAFEEDTYEVISLASLAGASGDAPASVATVDAWSDAVPRYAHPGHAEPDIDERPEAACPARAARRRRTDPRRQRDARHPPRPRRRRPWRRAWRAAPRPRLRPATATRARPARPPAMAAFRRPAKPRRCSCRPTSACTTSAPAASWRWRWTSASRRRASKSSCSRMPTS
jgi:hypothetical protein